ncbi:MAG: hypothetical protein GF330_06580, partial [Candidatus Eisenbacteria bacterium]|nr:hypothetical protein [Candidatus Eisenbacteria bacterium]
MSSWSLVYHGYDPQEERLREALCTLGNGYFCTRAAAEEAEAGEHHYPGTYLAGGYNRLTSEIDGQIIENESLVNLPNWLPLSFRCVDGTWFDVERTTILDYCQTLDLRRGLLERRIRFRDAQDRTTRLTSRRLVHMNWPHLAALQWKLEAEDWDGRVQFRTALDGRIRNAGVERYRALSGRHLEPIRAGSFGRDGISLLVRTNQSRLEIAEAACTRLWEGEELQDPDRQQVETPDGYIAQLFTQPIQRGTPLVLEKNVALYTSRDPAISESEWEARRDARCAPRFETQLQAHDQAWRHLWHQFGIRFRDRDAAREERTARTLRLHTLHLLQTASPNTTDMALDVGIPPRGWTGEAYRGHIMWDELFIFPFLNLRIPEITRNILLYRFRRLTEARRAARTAGLRGAMYPWQSGSDGREESQTVHLNPRSGRWIPDHSNLQRHVNAAIVYNIWNHYEVTRDRAFLAYYGAEMILEIARLFDSLTEYDDTRERFVIRGVIGPDEYHEGYPDADQPGVDNNAYTNVLVVWALRRALELCDLLSEDALQRLRNKLALRDAELDRWRAITHRMFVPFHNGQIISQF